MQPRLPDELLRSHAHLSSLEQELGKQRDSLIREYQRGGATSTQQLYGSYYPMLEHFTHLENQYVAELSKFKNGLKQTMDQNQPQQSNQVIPNNNVNPTQSQQPQTVPVVNQPQPVVTNNNVNATSRKIASMNVNGNNNNNNNYDQSAHINNDDAKQPDIINPTQQQTSAQQASQETEMKVSALYGDDANGTGTGTGTGTGQQQQSGAARTVPRKPPVRQSNSNTASLSIPASAQQVQTNNVPRNASQIVQSPPSSSQQQDRDAPPQRIVQQRKPKKIVVNRHKYKYEGRGFDIWTRNLKRPIYTSTTIKINKTFGKNEKAIRQFLQQKGGLKEALIEQVTFIDPKKNAGTRGGGRTGGNNQRDRGGDNRPMKPFTIVRVRTSLTTIKNVIDRIKRHPDLTKENQDNDFIRKQNNRTRIENRNGTSNKLYIKNFDILDKNTHWELTKIFLRFGELEQDIFIGRDKRQNPYAFVVYRTREAAKRCIQQHMRRETAIYFPPKQKDNNDNDDYQTGSPSNKVYLNRKLHIEYNISKDDNNTGGYNNRGSNRGRRGGRGRGGRGGGRR